MADLSVHSFTTEAVSSLLYRRRTALTAFMATALLVLAANMHSTSPSTTSAERRLVQGTASAVALVADPKTIQHKSTSYSPIDFHTVPIPLNFVAHKLQELQSPLVQTMNFVNHVDRFDARVLFVGDSVGEHLAEGFSREVLHDGDNAVQEERMFLKKGSELVLTQQTSNARGDGYVGFVKTFCMPRRRGNESSRSFKMGIVCEYSNDELQVVRADDDIPLFDVLVYRLPWPHMYASPFVERDYVPEIGLTKEQIEESLLVLHAMFEVKTVILPTFPYNNNVDGHIEWFRRDNEVLRHYVETFLPKGDGSGIQRILVMEWETFTNELIVENGRLMGLSPKESFQVKLDKPYHPLVAMRCSGLHLTIESRQPKSCGSSRFKRESISKDGMHWNDLFIGRRSNAGLLCLMQCFYDLLGSRQLRLCQEKCNATYMTLQSLFPGATTGPAQATAPSKV